MTFASALQIWTYGIMVAQPRGGKHTSLLPTPHNFGCSVRELIVDAQINGPNTHTRPVGQNIDSHSTSQTMSRLARLNYDILFSILSHLNTRRSLLYLALTCRKMRDVVIPEFLYAHVEFGLGEGIEQLELLRISSFCKAVTSPQTTAGDAVRHITLKLDPRLFST